MLNIKHSTTITEEGEELSPPIVDICSTIGLAVASYYYTIVGI